MVSLTKVFGFGRGVYGTVSLYIAIYLLGSKGLKLALMLPMGIGTAVGTLLVNLVLKKFSTKKTFILFCCYGASALAILFLVSRVLASIQILSFRSLSSTSSAVFSTVTQTLHLTL